MVEDRLFLNEFVIKKDDLKKFVSYIIVKQRILLLVLGAISLITGYFEFKAENKIFAIVLLVIGIIGLIMFFALQAITVKSIEKTGKIGINQRFEFYANKITVLEDDKEYSMNYDAIENIVDKDEEFYLMLGKERGFIIKKKAFKEGTYEEFNKFINKKVELNEKIRPRGG